METHVLFTLLTCSLVQLYLSKKHLSDPADKTIDSLRHEERLGKDSVVVYGKQNEGIVPCHFERLGFSSAVRASTMNV